jgi:hypothetical protein
MDHSPPLSPFSKYLATDIFDYQVTFLLNHLDAEFAHPISTMEEMLREVKMTANIGGDADITGNAAATGKVKEDKFVSATSKKKKVTYCMEWLPKVRLIVVCHPLTRSLPST